MLNYHNLIAVNTLSLCKGAASSFVSYGNCYESLIDHVLIPETSLDAILSCDILDDHILNVSRHRPIFLDLSVSAVTNPDSLSSSRDSHIKWNKVDPQTLNMYRSCLDDMLLAADYSGVSDINSRITQRYNDIADGIKIISDSILPKSNFRHYLKPYWNKNMKDLHAVMRQTRRVWIAMGRPRGNNHDSYRHYKRAKSLFRSYHRKCAEQYLVELNAEIDSAAEMDSAYFWKKINLRRRQSVTHAGNEIEFNGRIYRDAEDIANCWGFYFQNLYSDTERPQFDRLFQNDVDSRAGEILRELSSCPNNKPVSFTAEDINNVTKTLKTKKGLWYRWDIQ